MDYNQAVEFIKGGPSADIKDLAKMQKAIEVIKDSVENEQMNLSRLPEYISFQKEQEKLQAHPLYAEVSDMENMLSEAEGLFNNTVKEYKAMQIERYAETGEKDYPGGGLQIRKALAVIDTGSLVRWLIFHNFTGYLRVDDTLIKDQWTQEFILFNQIQDLVSYVDKPVATLSKDLSEFLEE